MTLLEREPALEALQGALGEVVHGEGRVALVYGEAGIGKTSLVDCFARAPGQPAPGPLQRSKPRTFVPSAPVRDRKSAHPGPTLPSET